MKSCFRLSTLTLLTVICSLVGISNVEAQEGYQTPESQFQFPYVSEEGHVYFYSEWEGALKRKLLSNNSQKTETLDSSFGTVEHITWSPNGERALVKARNSPPASRPPRFFNEDAPLESFQWWIYSVSDQSVEMLNRNIQTPTWINNKTIVYNFNDSEISVKRVSSNDFTTISKNARRTDDLPTGVSTVQTPKFAILPANSGIHIINKDTREMTFTEISQLRELTGNPFEDKLLFRTPNGLKILDLNTSQIQDLSGISNVQSAIFHEADILAVLQADGSLQRYSLSAQSTSPVRVPQAGRVLKLYTLPSDQTILLGENGVFRSQLTPQEEPQTLIPYGEETVSPDDTTSSNSDNEGANLWLLMGGVLLVFIAVGSWIYITFFRDEE